MKKVQEEIKDHGNELLDDDHFEWERNYSMDV